MSTDHGWYYTTDHQDAIAAALDARKIPYTVTGTGGNCSALVVADTAGTIQVAVTNCEDSSFAIDARQEPENETRNTCALFYPYPVERWGFVVYSREDDTSAAAVREFVAVAAYLTDTDSDPYEHRLENGAPVADLFAPDRDDDSDEVCDECGRSGGGYCPSCRDPFAD